MRKWSARNDNVKELGYCQGSQAFVTSSGGRMCKSLELCARDILGYCNQGLMGHGGKTVEDQMLLERQMVKSAQQVVGEPRTLLGPTWASEHSCYILCLHPPPKKILATFCPCSKNLSEAGFKYNKLFGVGILLVCFLFIELQWSSLCRSGWLKRSSFLYLPSAGIQVVCYHSQFVQEGLKEHTIKAGMITVYYSFSDIQ